MRPQVEDGTAALLGCVGHLFRGPGSLCAIGGGDEVGDVVDEPPGERVTGCGGVHFVEDLLPELHQVSVRER